MAAKLTDQELVALNVYASVCNNHGSLEVISALERLLALSKKLSLIKVKSTFTVGYLEDKLQYERNWKPTVPQGVQ